MLIKDKVIVCKKKKSHIWVLQDFSIWVSLFCFGDVRLVWPYEEMLTMLFCMEKLCVLRVVDFLLFLCFGSPFFLGI